MPRINCEQRMREFLEKLEMDAIDGRFVACDTHEECIETWSRDYAISLIDIEERAFLDVDAVVDALVARAAKRFGKTFEVVRGRGEAKSNQVIRIWRLGSWSIELEAYRETQKEDDECDES
jgi:hypothetical protein